MSKDETQPLAVPDIGGIHAQTPAVPVDPEHGLPPGFGPGWQGRLLFWIAVAFSLFQIATAFNVPLDHRLAGVSLVDGLRLTMAAWLVAILIQAVRSRPWLDMLLAFLPMLVVVELLARFGGSLPNQILRALHVGFLCLVAGGLLAQHKSHGRLAVLSAWALAGRVCAAPLALGANALIARLLAPQEMGEYFVTQSVVILGLRSVMCAPLQLKDNILGVIYVDNRMQAGIFTQSDLELVSAIASNAAIAIDNARLYQLAVEKGRLERELQMARQVQVSLLPTQVPQLPGWEFAARWLPARQVAGDFYDFLMLDPDRMGVVIADVSDKGMPASLFMALTRTIIRASMDHSTSPAATLERVNRLICADSANGMFVTLFFAQIDHPSGQLTYVNAGHNPPIFYRQHSPSAQANHIQFLTRSGMAVGIETDNLYEQCTIQLSKGDFVLLYTDGVTDAQNPMGEYFGIERLVQLLSTHKDSPAENLLQNIESALADFTAEQDPSDDITLLIIRRL